MAKRASGILLHPTSLPGPSGIGDIGKTALCFLDWLQASGQTLWQILPVGPTGMGNSPYGASSSYAGNPLLISLDGLVTQGMLESEDLRTDAVPDRATVDYSAVQVFKDRALRQAWERLDATSRNQARSEIEDWSKSDEQAVWLDDWTLFAALKRKYNGSAWFEWPTELRELDPQALRSARDELKPEIEFQGFVQFIFYKQWSYLRSAAAQRHIRLIGDLPFYVAHDSADVWSNQEYFELGPDGRPGAIAGVPPDYFSPTGQLWGNPIYRWGKISESGYDWWIKRLAAQLRTVDLLRLDHFRGFASYWQVDAEEPTAKDGRWQPGPGADLFIKASERLGDLPIIAEDLGHITDDVRSLREDLKLPGMKVLQFAFDSADSEHLPHNYKQNTVVYTGTHDNDTTRGWFDAAEPETRERALNYLGCEENRIPWDFVRAALTSVADIAIVPIQDIFGLDGRHRMNTPGTDQGNWEWRLPDELLSEEIGDRLRDLTEVSGRFGKKDQDS